MKKLLFITLIALFISCTKENIKEPTCQRIFMLSDKYSIDTVYLRTDSIFPWGRLHNDFCGEQLNQFKSDTSLLRLCEDQTFERKRYVIGNVITQPFIYKP
jgi:hypothetical protein